MKCHKCGTQILDTDAFCSICGAENIEKYFEQFKTKRNLILSIITTALCCVPFGITGIILNEYKVKPSIINHDFDNARKISNMILWLQITGIILGIISGIINIVLEIAEYA